MYNTATKKEDRVDITLTKKGLIIYCAILIALDLLSTFLVARADLGTFLQYEINPLMRWAFLQYGWVAFLFYPIIPLGLYFILIITGFWLLRRRMILRGYFYFLFTYINIHLLVVINNLALWIGLSCK
jgi:hypothetical protein